MLAGTLDRRITIERRTVVYDTVTKAPVSESWTAVCTVFAQVQDMIPSRAERVSEGIDLTQRPCRVRIRWRDDIDAAMRVNFGGRLMQIVSGPAELGRRDGLEFVCEQLSTEGVQP